MTNYQQILNFSELIAEAILKRTNPKSDEISRNQAAQLYGTTWVNAKIESGELSTNRRGTGKNAKITLSRHALDCLWQSEHGLRAELALEYK